jgi:hypothetical protein
MGILQDFMLPLRTEFPCNDANNVLESGCSYASCVATKLSLATLKAVHSSWCHSVICLGRACCTVETVTNALLACSNCSSQQCCHCSSSYVRSSLLTPRSYSRRESTYRMHALRCAGAVSEHTGCCGGYVKTLKHSSRCISCNHHLRATRIDVWEAKRREPPSLGTLYIPHRRICAHTSMRIESSGCS